MPIERKLAAIMFTDIVGYTAQMSKDEAVAISLLNKQESILKPLILEHNGTYVKSTGDGTLSHFNSAVDAATCAKRFQESIYDDKDLNVRVGVHLGDTIFEKGDIRGDGVNIASRLESMAVEGGVFVSKEVHDQLANQKEFEGVSLGLQSMKGVGRLIEVYGLKGDKLNEPNPSEYQENRVDKHSDDEVPSIAIIPFRNKGKEEDAFYAYGICADLISDCSSAGLIRVASLNNIEKIENYESLQAEELASKLDVRYTAEGTLWKMADMFQLSVELYDTKDKKVVWSDRWQEKWDNLPTIKGSLSDGLLKALDTTSNLEKKVETTNTEAYEYYLKARYKFDKREDTYDVEITQGLLRKAIELDENFIGSKVLLGSTYVEICDYQIAMEIFISAYNHAEKFDDKLGIASSLHAIGNLHIRKGEYDKALDSFKKSLPILKNSGFMQGMAYCLSGIGSVYSHKGDYKKSLDYNQRSLTIFEKISEKRGIAQILSHKGVIYWEIGDYDNSIECHKRSLELKEEIGNKHGIGYSLNTIGIVYTDKGDYDKAKDYLDKSLVIRKELGDKYGIGMNLNSIGYLYMNKGDYDKAIDYYKRSLTIFENNGNKEGMGFILNNIGVVFYIKSDYISALDYLQKSLSIQKEIGIKRLELETTTYLYLTYTHLGKDYDIKKIHSLIKDAENIEFELNLRLYELLEDISYLETAYNQVQEKADNLEPDVAAKFLSYPIPKAIVEEWEKVK